MSGTTFEVNTNKALEEVFKLQAGFQSLGAKADEVERKIANSSATLAKLLKASEPTFERLAAAARGAGVSVDQLNKMIGGTEAAMVTMLAKITQQNLQASTQARAYNGELKELQKLMNSTSAMESFVKYQRQSANLAKDQAEQNKFLKVALSQMLTEVGKTNSVLKAQANLTKQVVTEDVRLYGELGKLQRANSNFTGSIREQIAVQKEVLKGKTQEATQRQKEINQVSALQQLMNSLKGGYAQEIATLKLMTQARQREVTEEARQKIALAELHRELKSLNGGMAESIVRSEMAVSARRKQIQEDNRAAVAVRELTQAEAQSQAATERSTSVLTHKNKATLEVARGLYQLTMEEARARAQAEAAAASNKKHSEALMEEARAVYGTSKAQKELTRAYEDARAKLDRLRAQKDLLAGSYGRELAAVKAQIKEQERYNRLLNMSTRELLGFASAQNKKTKSMQAGAQTAAMMRAALSGLQTNIGMYTSSTILAASATYALFNAMRSTVVLGAEYTKTMARANAIMSSAGTSLLPASMDSMEAQVRALGQTTVFTASQVAGGLVELGMAGLSASDSIMALKPALDLAQIGNIDMAQSADIATNVMMTFGMGAKDLTEVVDIMATAVTNSNTTIEQLANALTYAGPAAHTAGISIKETVGAIETLANTGIKASRAGTSLRRLFVSLLNPTKKGAEMLDKYNIAVQHADGSTRSLVDIVKDLNTALNDIDVTEAERLGAIQDLVGVYATSPIAALIENADDLERMVYLLDEVGGAADRMRKTMEDGLFFDWRKVISSYEEVQLQAFESFEKQLQVKSLQLTNWLIELTEPYKAFDMNGVLIPMGELQDVLSRTGGEAEVIITHLDMLIQKATTFGESLAYAFAGFAAYKLIKGGAGGAIGALSADLQKGAERLAIFAGRIDQTSKGLRQIAPLHRSAATSLNIQSAAAIGTTTAMSTLGTATAWAAKGTASLLAYAGSALTFLGWAAAIGSVGYALYNAFSTDHEKAIKDQKNEVKALTDQYENLKKSIDESSLAQTKAALAKQLAADKARRAEYSGKIAGIEKDIAIREREGIAIPQSLEQELKFNRDQVAKLSEAIDYTNETINKLQKTQVEAMEANDVHLKQTEELVRLKGLQAEAELLWKNSFEESGEVRLKAKQDYDNLTVTIEALTGWMNKAAKTSRDFQQDLQTMSQQYDKMVESHQESLRASVFEKYASDAEKLLAINEQIRKKEEEVIQVRNRAMDPGRLERLGKELLELQEERIELQTSVTDTRRSMWDIQQQMNLIGETEQQSLLRQQNELAVVEGQLRNIQDMREAGALAPELLDEKQLELLERQLELKTAIYGLENKKPQASRKSEYQRKAEELEKYLKQMQLSATSALELAEAYRVSEDAVDRVTLKQQVEVEVLNRGEKAREAVTQAIYDLKAAEDKRDIEKSVSDLKRENQELASQVVAVLAGTEALEAFNLEKQLSEALSGKSTTALKAETDELRRHLVERQKQQKLLERVNRANALVDEYDDIGTLTRQYREDLASLYDAMMNTEGGIEKYSETIERLGQTYQANLRELTAWGRLTDAAIERVDESFANAWKNIDDGFDGFAAGLKDGFKQLLAELAHEAITRPIIISFANSILGTGKAGGIADVWFGQNGLLGGGSGGAGGGGMGLGQIAQYAQTGYSLMTGVGPAAMAGYQSGGIMGGLQGVGSYYGNLASNAWSTASGWFGGGTAAAGGVQGGAGVMLDASGNIVNYGAQSGGAGVMGQIGQYAGPIALAVAAVNAYKALQDGYEVDASRIDPEGRGGVGGYFQSMNYQLLRGVENLDEVLEKIFGGGFVGRTMRLGTTIVGQMMETFFGGGWKTKDVGLALSATSGDFVGQAYEYQKKKGGLLGKNKKRTNYTDLDPETAATLQAAYDATESTVASIFETLSLTVEEGSLAGLQLARKQISTKGKTEEEIQQAIAEWFGTAADAMTAELNKVFSTGLDLDLAGMQAFVGNLTGVNEVLRYLDVEMYDASVAGGKLAESLSAVAGGLEALATSSATYYDAFFSDAEKVEDTIDSITRAFEAADVTLAGSRAEYRAMVENIDLTTQAGQEMFATMMALSGQAAQYYEILEQQAQNAKEDLSAFLTAAVDGSFDEMQKSVAKEQQLVTDAYNARLTSLNDMASTAAANVSELTAVSNSLTNALRQLRGTSTEAVEMLREQAKATLRNALAGARAGKSLAGVEGLEDALSVASKLDAEVYSSLVDFEREQGRTANLISDLEKLNGKQLTADEKLLKSVQDQIAEAKLQYEAEMARLDAILDNAQAQLDALNGIDKSVKSVEAAIAAMNASVVAALSGMADGLAAKNTPANNSALIDSVYKSVLGRETDDAGAAFWQQQLASGDLDYDQLAKAIANDASKNANDPGAGSAADYLKNQGGLSVQDQVEAAYRATLGRSADAAGESYWMDQVRSGMSVAELAAAIERDARVNGEIKFATGGVFTNTIVKRPTAFNMAEMGEAGPEAILPLTNVGGSLGVRAVGGNSQRLEEKVDRLYTALQSIAKHDAKSVKLLETLDRWERIGMPRQRAEVTR